MNVLFAEGRGGKGKGTSAAQRHVELGLRLQQVAGMGLARVGEDIVGGLAVSSLVRKRDDDVGVVERLEVEERAVGLVSLIPLEHLIISI